MFPPISYTLVITNPALDDIEGIANFTTLQWGEKQAVVYKKVLFAALAALHMNPLQGRPHEGVAKAYKGWKAGKHVVFYRLEQATIYVVRILHDSMDFARHLD